jgi:hypothetical protein
LILVVVLLVQALCMDKCGDMMNMVHFSTKKIVCYQEFCLLEIITRWTHHKKGSFIIQYEEIEPS